MAGPLNPQQERFAREYLVDENATAAYARAGYKGNAKVRSVQGSRLLADPRVAALLASLRAASAKRLDITRDKIAQELAYLAFSDIRDFAKWSNSEIQIKDSADIPDSVSKAIAECSTTTVGTKIKLHDKRAALMDLARLLDLMPKEQDPEAAKRVGNITIHFGPAKVEPRG